MEGDGEGEDSWQAGNMGQAYNGGKSPPGRGNLHPGKSEEHTEELVTP